MAAAALLLAARAAGASDPRAAEAARRCAAGDARVGVALLMRVHVDTLEPRYVLDQAECLENNGLRAEAAERLEFYLSLTGTVSGADRLAAQGWLDRLRPKAAVTVPVSEVLRAPAPPEAKQRPADARTLTARHREPRRRQMSSRRLGSLLLAGAAGGVLAGATAMHVTRESRAGDYNRRCYPLHGASCDQMRGQVQAAQLGAVIGYATAALLAGGAVYLHATAPERAASERHAFHCRRGERSGELVCGTSY